MPPDNFLALTIALGLARCAHVWGAKGVEATAEPTTYNYLCFEGYLKVAAALIISSFHSCPRILTLEVQGIQLHLHRIWFTARGFGPRL